MVLTRGRGEALEVFLVERSRALRFFGGYWAVPGGVLDPGDGEPEDGRGLPAYERCALRELFEETGVGLGGLGSDWSPERRAEERRACLAEERAPFEADALERARPALSWLCTVRTPPFSALRYRTHYFHAELPEGEHPEIWEGELSDGRFWRPAELWRAWNAGELPVVPPVLVLMEQLVELGEWGDAFRERCARATRWMQDGRLLAPRVSPGMRIVPLQTPTLPPATTTNCVVAGERRRYLIDPATWDEAERERFFTLVDGWLEEGVELAGVIATHHHHDHVGSLGPVAERYGLEILGHPLTLERLPATDAPLRALGDGEELPLGEAPDGSADWRLRALHTPGHDRGHLAFLESRYSTLVAGDMLSTLSTIVIDPPEGHLATYLASLERLLALEPRVLVPKVIPAHPRGVELLSAYLEHRQAREQKLLDALAQGPAPASALLAPVYADTPPALHGVAARSLAAGLEKLSEEGRAIEREGVWALAGTLG